MSPIVDDPAAAAPLAGAVEVLHRLAGLVGRVAVVSGRPAAFLADRLRVASGLPEAMAVVGLYGLERVGADGSVIVPPEVERWRAVVAAAADEADAGAAPGATVERKGLSVTLHWRSAPGTRAWAEEFAARAAERHGLVVHPARQSCELRPPLPVDKGTAVEALAAGFGAACFLGDDVGDLPAFAALDRLAAGGAEVVKVAVHSTESPPELLAAADVTVDGPEGALGLLAGLADRAAAR